MATPKAKEFNLQPDPRILRMLGEINLAPWRCLAELVDNSIDGFLTAQRAGKTVVAPEVRLNLPTMDKPTVQLTVVDNGPGMSPDGLEQAVRAGWSGNNSLDSLGMFGMGFNIATARLGASTTVWTTQAGDTEWVGLTIDFDVLSGQRSFKTPRLKKSKTDPTEHGTQITIEKLKPEQRQWFAKAGNRAKLNNELKRVYAAMLRQGGTPIQFRLFVKGELLEGHRHCVWSGPGNTTRAAQTPNGQVDAFQPIDIPREPRPYCLKCWQWLAEHQTKCPFCEDGGSVQLRSRSIRGWIGIQRYLSETDYGIDFLRNGRKIEIANKDLFKWVDGEREELEYPIDDPRGRGRIVGEIHLDHCRVTYTKDRFERSDPAWEDMILAVRGEGPLRPEKAEEAGFGPNYSPLFKLYQAFRRSTIRTPVAGVYRRLLLVKDNPRATEMATRFRNGEPEYQTDRAWWALIEEADNELLQSQQPGAPNPAPPAGSGGPTLPGFAAPPTPPAPQPPGVAAPPTPPAPAPAPTPVTKPIVSLSQLFTSDVTGQRWTVSAVQADDTHPLLQSKRPWVLKAQPNGTHLFVVDLRHPVFASATMTPLDGLLAELAWSAMDFLRERPGDFTFGQILAELRARYATVSAIDPVSLSAEARRTLRDIAATLKANITPNDASALFEGLSVDAQEEALKKMAQQGANNAKAIISAGRFLEYVPARAVLDFFGKHPELFLDGKCWDDAYEEISYDLPTATNIARERVVRHYQSLLADAIWLAEQDVVDLGQTNRARLLRAMYALNLLEPTVEGVGA